MTCAVTAGVLVYNNGLTLRRAVESLIAQEFSPMIIHISDDASLDMSEQVGRELEQQYSCVKYTRQTENLGSSGNFRFLLNSADTKYFLWLAGDDFLLPGFLVDAVQYLNARPDVGTVASRAKFVNSSNEESMSAGTYALLGNVHENLAHYLYDPADNSRLFGLHRTAIMQKSFPPSHFHAFDWAAMAGSLLHGKHAELPEVRIVRDKTPDVNYVHQVRKDNPRRSSQLFPLLPMTRELVHRQKIPITSQIFINLVKINIKHHCWYTQVYHPKYYRFFGPLWWRFVRLLQWLGSKRKAAA